MSVCHLYLSLIPEALIASMLPPTEFGLYYAVGTEKRSVGQAMFFSVDRERVDPERFPLHLIEERCRPRPDGLPKRTIYLSIYRTLEGIGTDALTEIHLATDDGRVLTLPRAEYQAPPRRNAYFYQELCPVGPRVASRLDPAELVEYLTDPDVPIHLPRVAFCDLDLGDLANDPSANSVENIPYPNLGHLRDCLRELAAERDKPTKTVVRESNALLYRTVKSGFFVGDRNGTVSFPMPTRDELEREYYAWWRSAQATLRGRDEL